MARAPFSYSSALCDSITIGDDRVTRTLLESKACLNRALNIAISDKRKGKFLVAALIAQKASVDMGGNGQSVYDCCCRLKEELMQDKEEGVGILKLLLENKADPNKGEAPPLIEVCYYSPHRPEAIGLLLEYKANPNCISNTAIRQLTPGMTPLFIMSDSECLQGVELLLKHKANVNFFHKRWGNPLHAAMNFTKNEKLPLLRLLIQHRADVNARIQEGYYEGYTPLHKFVLDRDTPKEAIQTLLDAGANPHITVNRNGNRNGPQISVVDLLTFLKYCNISYSVCERLEHLWTLRRSLNIQECNRRLQAIKENIPSLASKRKQVQHQWDMRCLLEEYMQSPKTPDDRRREYFSKFCWREWARVLISLCQPGAWYPRSTKRSPSGGRDTGDDTIVQLRGFMQSLYKNEQRGIGTKIIQFCSAC